MACHPTSYLLSHCPSVHLAPLQELPLPQKAFYTNELKALRARPHSHSPTEHSPTQALSWSFLLPVEPLSKASNLHALWVLALQSEPATLLLGRLKDVRRQCVADSWHCGQSSTVGSQIGIKGPRTCPIQP